jgi:hypothetical protein
VKAFAIAGIVALVLAWPVRAGLYSTEEPFYFEIDSEGIAKPIQFQGGFESFVAELRGITILPKSPDEPPNSTRMKYLDRARQLQAKGPTTLSGDHLATYTADLIRLNRADEVVNLLHPIARDPRRGGFLAYAHLARAHAARGEWREAYEQQQMAVRYSEFPTSFGRLSRPQLAWLKRIEKDYYLPFFARRAEEPRRPGRELREDVDAIFPMSATVKKPEHPLQFVGPNGEYVAGSIAEAERRKLPPDALAIVQQLVLWHPHDARLFWLLGELYNAEGDVETAAKILDHCSFNMGYSNPVLLRHRQVLMQAAEDLRAAEIQRKLEEMQKREDAERAERRRMWWIVSIAVAVGLLLVYYQFREVFRRLLRNNREQQRAQG